MKKSVKIAIVSVFVALPLLFSFQNCSSKKNSNNSENTNVINLDNTKFNGMSSAQNITAASALQINLQDYIPTADRTTVTHRFSNGSLYSNYSYINNDANFNNLYNYAFNLNKPGKNFVWAKHYVGSDKPATYANIFLGNDKSVTEVGDWLFYDNDYVIFGYKNTSDQKISGLSWAPAGGYTRTSTSSTFNTSSSNIYTLNQEQPTNIYPNIQVNPAYLAYSYILVQHLPTFQPAHGSKDTGVFRAGGGKAYQDVVRLLFYHGTKDIVGSPSPNCSAKFENDILNTGQTNIQNKHYFKIPGYNSYVSEYYLAKNKWIIQERTLYIEDATYWRSGGANIADCSGGLFDSSHDNSFSATYIDEK